MFRHHRYFYYILFMIVPFLGEYLLTLPAIGQWHLPAPRSPGEVRMLLVADPHVHCYTPALGPLNYMIQADTDWFLYRYFRLALLNSDPSVVVVLGDVTEQGSTSSQESLLDCLRRFRTSFLDWHSIQVFIVPGDNDIGGQFEDLLTPEKYARFERVFGNYSLPLNVGFVQLHADLPRFDRAESLKGLKPPQGDSLVVVAAHYPFVTPYGEEFPKDLVETEPSILLFGHDHVAYALTWRRSGPGEREDIRWVVPPSSRRLPRTPLQLELVNRLGSADDGTPIGDVVGLGVPACGYRSGLPHLAAYGLLQVFPNRTLVYSLLPLPNRWLSLCLYTLVLSLWAGGSLLTRRSFFSANRPLSSIVWVLCLLATGWLGFRSLVYLTNALVGNL